MVLEIEIGMKVNYLRLHPGSGGVNDFVDLPLRKVRYMRTEDEEPNEEVLNALLRINREIEIESPDVTHLRFCTLK